MSQVILSAVPPCSAAMASAEFKPGLLSSASEAPQAALHVGLLNLMPNKEETERQWLRLLLSAGYPNRIHLHLLKLNSWRPTHAHPMHMARYYQTIEQALLDNTLDMLIITGAPLGRVEYDDVGYWHEFTALLCELEVRGLPVLFSCWAAQAALHHLYAIPTVRKSIKLSGVFSQNILPHSAAPQRVLQLHHRLQRAAQDAPLQMPHSRFALPEPAALGAQLAPLTDGRRALTALLGSQQTGISTLSDEHRGHLFLLGHPEYESDTLALEYARDVARDASTQLPYQYQPGSPATLTQSAQWQALGARLMEYWLARY